MNLGHFACLSVWGAYHVTVKWRVRIRPWTFGICHPTLSFSIFPAPSLCQPAKEKQHENNLSECCFFCHMISTVLADFHTVFVWFFIIVCRIMIPMCGNIFSKHLADFLIQQWFGYLFALFTILHNFADIYSIISLLNTWVKWLD